MKNSDSLKWVLLIVCAFIWGFSFFFIKKGLIAFDSHEVALLRISITAIVLSPLLLIKRFRVVPKGSWLWIAAVGILGSAFPPFLFSEAQIYVDSSVAGILNSLTPVFTLLIGIVLFKTKYKAIQIVGLSVALAGAMALVFLGSEKTGTVHIMSLLIVAATICYASSVNIVKSKTFQIHPISLTIYSFVIIGIPALIALPFTSFSEHLNHPQVELAFGSVAALAIVGTGLATILFYYLVSISSALFSSTVTYLIPIVAIILGNLDQEQISGLHILSLMLILLGVYLVGKKRRLQ